MGPLREAAQIRTAVANLQRAERRGLTAKESASQESPAEEMLMEAFLETGLEPVQQHPFGAYDADFYFPESKVCVEVDGRQHFKRDHWLRDRVRDRVLWERYGVRTLRIAAWIVRVDRQACVKMVVHQMHVFDAQRREAG